MFEAKATLLTQSVVESFKQKFLSGELKPGQNLPSERELAAQLNVSRTTVRDAITALRAMGLVEVKQGKCATVTAPSLTNVIEPLSMIGPLDPANILNLLELREILEPQCVMLATRRVSPEELQKIKNHLSEMKKTQKDLPCFVQADFAFHQSIMKATHNGMIDTFTTVFRTLLFHLQGRMAGLPETDQAHIEHEQVFQAMADGDPERAAQSMAILIRHTRERYLRMSG